MDRSLQLLTPFFGGFQTHDPKKYYNIIELYYSLPPSHEGHVINSIPSCLVLSVLARFLVFPTCLPVHAYSKLYCPTPGVQKHAHFINTGESIYTVEPPAAYYNILVLLVESSGLTPQCTTLKYTLWPCFLRATVSSSTNTAGLSSWCRLKPQGSKNWSCPAPIFLFSEKLTFVTPTINNNVLEGHRSTPKILGWARISIKMKIKSPSFRTPLPPLLPPPSPYITPRPS